MICHVPQDLLIYFEHALDDCLQREILSHELIIDVVLSLQDFLLIIQHVPRVQMIDLLVLCARLEGLQLVHFLLIEWV